MRRGDLYRRRLDVPAAQERRHRAVQAAARHKRHLLGRHVPAVDRHRRRGVRDGEIHSEIRPRGVCETREPEPAPRRQGRGNQPHKGNRAGQGQHQDELDPVAARTGRPYARISRETIPAAAPRCPPQPRCRTLYCKNGTAEARRAEPAAGNLPRKKMNRHPDSEKISYLSENKTARHGTIR